MWFDETGLPWVTTSPAMPHLSTATVYPGTCFLEGTNVSEGRGTALPFEQFGAPWMDAYAVAEALNAAVVARTSVFRSSSDAATLKGAGAQPRIQNISPQAVVFAPPRSSRAAASGPARRVTACRFTSPTRRLAAGAPGGADHRDLEGALSDAVRLARLSAGGRHEVVHPGPADRLGRVRQALDAGATAAEIIAPWAAAEEAFRQGRRPYLLYE